MKKSIFLKLTGISICTILTASVLCGCGSNNSSSSTSENTGATEAVVTTTETEKPLTDKDLMSEWTFGSASRDTLVKYIEAITDEESQDYIPEEDRIAVFDFDGTLFCETDPVYFDYQLFMHRVKDDKTYKPTQKELETADKIQQYIDTGESAEGLEVAHGEGIASSFAGMTVDEFNDYVKAFRETDCPSYNGMKRGEAYYLPMLQLIDYITANGFKVYIVSGTDRLIVRGLTEGMLNIPPSQVIGSDETIVASGQGDKDGLEYLYTENDKLILGGDFIVKNLKMNKVSVIMQEIGQQPVLSFGNSTGDSSMAEYVTSNNKYKSLAFMLCCDDTVRENGNEDKAKKMYDLCKESGWVAISMKNDWNTIYGSGVSRK